MDRKMLVALMLLAAPARAKPDNPACKDKNTPFVTRYPGFYLDQCEQKSYEEVAWTIDGKYTKLGGKYAKLTFYTDEQGLVPLVLYRNYETALRKSGFTLRYQNELSILIGSLKKGEQEVWLRVEVLGHDHVSVMTVEPKPIEQKMEAVDAASLLDGLSKSGRVAVYGIQFDTGKATIKADSAKVLKEIATLLTNNSELKLLIEGHTDNVGKPVDNLTLSKKRAASVKEWLVKNKIDGKRLATDGFGAEKPVGDNATEEGRAQNRRVELVKQ